MAVKEERREGGGEEVREKKCGTCPSCAEVLRGEVRENKCFGDRRDKMR